MPCGHPICRTCYGKITPSGGANGQVVKKCPWCREPAPSANPLFLNGGYKQKYLKYKEKYLKFKNKIL